MKIVNCRSCGESVVFLNNRQTGKAFPVNAHTIAFDYDTDDGFDATKGHVSHFVTCPQRDEWRKDKSKNLKSGGNENTLFQ